MNRYFKVFPLALLSFAEPHQNESLAKDWVKAVHLSIESQLTQKNLPSRAKEELEAMSRIWACDTVALSYKTELVIRSMFIKQLLEEDKEVFKQNLVIAEVPISGEVATNNFFVSGTKGNKRYIKKFTLNGNKWYKVSESSRLDNYDFNGIKMTYSRGSNSNRIIVIKFHNYAKNVTAQYYPAGSYSGNIGLFYSM